MVNSLLHTETFSYLITITFISFLLGKIVIKNNWMIGMVTSFLILITSSNLAFFISFYYNLNTVIFTIFFLVITFGFLFFIKRLYLLTIFIKDSMIISKATVILSLFIFIYFFVNSTLDITEPSSGTHFFQAWYPLYAEYIIKNNTFIFNNVNLSEGFLINSMYYAPNSFGLLLGLSSIGIVKLENLFYMYNAMAIFSTILTFALLTYLLQTLRSIYPQLMFITLMILYTQLDYYERMVYVGNFGDEILYLASTFAFFFFISNNVCKDKISKYQLTILFFAFAVLGRNYAMFFMGLFAVYYSYIFYALENNDRGFIILLVNFINKNKIIIILSLLIIFKEVYQIFMYGVTFPRNELKNIYIYSYEIFSQGLLSALNIGYYVNDAIKFNIKSIYLISLLFIVIIFFSKSIKNKKKLLFVSLLPLIFLFLPLLLEIATQYRKNVIFSKLYIPFLFLPFWYPAYICKLFFYEKLIINTNLKLVKILYFSSIGFFIFCITNYSHYATYTPQFSINYIKDAIYDKLNGNVRYKTRGQILLEDFKKNIAISEQAEIINKPIVYFHYEPGLDYRYYFGGDISNDFDFWSKKLRNLFQDSKNFEDFFCKLGLPNLLLYEANGNVLLYNSHMREPLTNSNINELINFISSDKVNLISNAHGLKLYRIAKSKVNCD